MDTSLVLESVLSCRQKEKEEEIDSWKPHRPIIFNITKPMVANDAHNNIANHNNHIS